MAERPLLQRLKPIEKQTVQPPGFVSRTLSLALEILVSPFQRAFRLVIGAVRSITPRLIPLVTCLILIPFLVFLSAASGLYVWKHVAVGWEVPLYLQYGLPSDTRDGLPPYAEVLLPTLSSVQPYDISLHLVVPAMESNFVLGNFMSALTLTAPSNKTLIKIRRPSIIVSPNAPFVPLLFPKKNTVALDVEFLSSYVTGSSIVSAKVEVGRQDGWKSLGTGEGRELSVLLASISGTVRHKGIRGIISRYPVSSALVAAGVFLTTSLLVLAACLLPSLRWEYDGEGPEPEAIVGPDTGKRVKKKRSSKRSKSQGRGRIKDETPADIIPKEESTSTPLRRRRSRLQELSDSE
ncbi:hypothetical protein EW146_g2554 [Bondarzewia mesenterica]|uniref:Seipin n=1 Tax=Bondarzewia mesenterica TaxID=1095465 RepID=A0A4V3XFQ3_9AGAM|nr:hypothetical protein EW146_g2554 [Bondarzewia mesenterica]